MQNAIKSSARENHAESRQFTTDPPTLAQNLPRGWRNATSLADAEWMSLPRPRERDRYANLSRTTLIELLNRGDVKGCVLRRPGATRGKRLVHLPSLRAYLERLADEETTRRAGRKATVDEETHPGV